MFAGARVFDSALLNSRGRVRRLAAAVAFNISRARNVDLACAARACDSGARASASTAKTRRRESDGGDALLPNVAGSRV